MLMYTKLTGRFAVQVLLDLRSADEVVTFLDAAIRYRLPKTDAFALHWLPADLDALLPLLSCAARVEYDYQTETLHMTMPASETAMHFQTQIGLGRLLEDKIGQLARDTTLPDGIRVRLGNVYDSGTMGVDAPGQWIMQPDVSFREMGQGPVMPSPIAEVA